MTKLLVRRMITSPKYPTRAADAADMLTLLGVEGAHWPDAGIAPQIVQGVKVWVEPKNVKPNGKRSAKHRVRCECPSCEAITSPGRLHQHVCGAKYSRLKKAEPAHDTGRMSVEDAEAAVAAARGSIQFTEMYEKLDKAYSDEYCLVVSMLKERIAHERTTWLKADINDHLANLRARIIFGFVRDVIEGALS